MTGLNPWLEQRLERSTSGGPGPVVDVGCGRGYWMQAMAGLGPGVIGVERDLDRAAAAARHGLIVCGDAARLPLADESVAAVWSVHVLHHLPEPVRVLAEVRRVLRPGGTLVLAESVEDNPLLRLARRLHPSWDGVAVHARFTARTLLDDVTEAGLDVIEHRQHSLVSFAAWALPAAGRPAWQALERLESRLPDGVSRWGAHLECLARRPA
ncbi:MAG: class I SAM-dependent methyltransferase [Actinomycetota bacterium]|nr:class I SAM-dependent methyltransferase [Actinomycetota bacterium]